MIPKRTILIVDDEPMLREATASYLEQKGFRVLTAETGRQALTVFARDELIEYALGDDFDGYDRVIDTHIKNLRKKIEDDPRDPVYVCTVRGSGYRFGGDAT